MSLNVNIQKTLPNFNLKVNFEHKQGILGFLGSSGSGKSMTLKCISGLLTPSFGKIHLNNKTLFDCDKKINLTPQKRKVGYLFQNYALFPNMKVFENIQAGIFDMDKTQKKILTNNYIESFGLNNLINSYPWQLSGGEQQRVALARALITSPDILLLDEPFSALDQHLRTNMEKELKSLLKNYSGTVIFVTHDISEAYRICDDILVFDNGTAVEPRCKQDLFNNPKTFAEATLTGCRNISKAIKTDSHKVYATDWGHEYEVIGDVPENINYICIRAHNIQISNNANDINTFPYTVYNIVENPFEFTIYMKNLVSENTTLVEFKVEKSNIKLSLNDTVYLKFSSESLFYF